MEKTDFSIGVVIPVTHVNEVLNTLQIPIGKDGFSLTSLTSWTSLSHHRPSIPFLSPKERSDVSEHKTRQDNVLFGVLYSPMYIDFTQII